MKQIKAVGLLSGGLDSTLATAMLLEQGVDVHGLNFSTGFCLTDHRRAMRKDAEPKKVRNEALRCGSDFNVPVDIVDICNPEYLNLVTHPKYGYGKAANPCIDCRGYMFTKAREHMERIGADFVFSGEVLGQRPMSQHLRQMKIIARDSGLGNRLLRPLSARLMEPTLPEIEGRLDRSRLGNISGRSRKGQFELARKYGLTDFPQPAGGCCYLTDPHFAVRFRDFLKFQPETYVPRYNDFLLLKVGRHLRLPTGTKVIVGRDDAENQFLSRFFQGHWVFQVEDIQGPLVLSPGPNGDKELIAGIAARYSDAPRGRGVRVRLGPEGRFTDCIQVEPSSPDLVETWLL